MSYTMWKNVFQKSSTLIASLKGLNRGPRHCFHKSSIILGIKGIEIKMPSLSPTMTEGTIVKWLKNEGDEIVPGDVLCEIQTDKAIVALEVEDEGILAKILVPDNTKDIKIGTLIGLMVEEGQDWKDVEIPALSLQQPKETTTASEISNQIDSTKKATKRRMMGPAVKTLLEKYRIDPDKIISSGPHNALLKIDIVRHVEMHSLKQKIPEVPVEKVIATPIAMPIDQAYIDIPLSNMRRTIAKRLTESKTTIPHSYMSISSHVDNAIKLRKQLKEDGINVSLNDFVIKAVASALQVVPEVNILWSRGSAQRISNIDVSIAVATDSGLITPIIRNADTLGIQQISSTLKELARKAREGKLQPHEFQGGSFSISNLGMYGIIEFTAVINPPQAAILAVGTLQTVLSDSEKVQTLMTSTLSFDGRAIDDTSAANFLKAFQQNLEEPVNMILSAKQKSEVTLSG